jgi:hypothetical protein
MKRAGNIKQLGIMMPSSGKGTGNISGGHGCFPFLRETNFEALADYSTKIYGVHFKRAGSVQRKKQFVPLLEKCRVREIVAHCVRELLLSPRDHAQSNRSNAPWTFSNTQSERMALVPILLPRVL